MMLNVSTVRWPYDEQDPVANIRSCHCRLFLLANVVSLAKARMAASGYFAFNLKLQPSSERIHLGRITESVYEKITGMQDVNTRFSARGTEALQLVIVDSDPRERCAGREREVLISSMPVT
jgi:hypothetical protein